MSALDKVREKFQTPMSGTCKTGKSHSAGFAGTPDTHLKSPEPRIVTCSACRHFAPRPGEQPDGRCGKYATDTWGAVPFTCPGFESADPAVRAREARRTKVVAELQAHPEQQRAFDAVGVLLEASRGEPVSVVVAVRHGGEILSGELLVPRERWSAAALIAVLDTSGRPS